MQAVLTKQTEAESFAAGFVKRLYDESESVVRTGRRMILPAAWRHQARLAQAVAYTEQAGVDCRDQKTALQAFVDLVYQFNAALTTLAQATAVKRPGDTDKQATYLQEKVAPLLDSVRTLTTQLESQVSADLWPLRSGC